MSITPARPKTSTGSYRPLTRIPERRSSRLFHPRAPSRSTGEASVPLPAAPISSFGPSLKPPDLVTLRGRSVSPIRRPTVRGHSSRTYIPAVLPTDILDVPKLTHPRLSLDVRLSAPLFVGGATVEGDVRILIDRGFSDRRRSSLPSLKLQRVSVSVVGIEYCKGRQDLFRALTTNVVRVSDPPIAADVSKSFSVDLPVFMGPPPYKSRKAGIKYIVSCLAEAQIAGKVHFVRQSKDITVLTAHDPQKTLVNLSNPLVVSDELNISRQPIFVTAGIHRQTWVGGYLLFVDIRIDNRSNRAVRKIELQLERVTIFHVHTAPSLGKASAEQLRMPDEIHKEILARKNILAHDGEIRPRSHDFRTAQLKLPSGLASIESGRFFGVRHFLNIQVSCAFNKRVTLQLPITLVHPNSIDIPPNALAQVTASIEHKQQGSSSSSGAQPVPYRRVPGSTLAAARRQSIPRLQKQVFSSSDLESVTRAIESSPRKLPSPSNMPSKTPHRHSAPPRKPYDFNQGSPQRMKVTRRQSAAVIGTSSSPQSSHPRPIPGQPRSFDHNHLRYEFSRSSIGTSQPLHTGRGSQRVSFDDTVITAKGDAADMGRSTLQDHVLKHLRLDSNATNSGAEPGLQRSTSGIGFDDSEKENRGLNKGYA